MSDNSGKTTDMLTDKDLRRMAGEIIEVLTTGDKFFIGNLDESAVPILQERMRRHILNTTDEDLGDTMKVIRYVWEQLRENYGVSIIE